jgi:flagellar protein FlbD
LQERRRRSGMIEVTKINGTKLLVNTSLIETVEETPDTVITLTDGKKVIIKESRHEVKNLVKLTRQEYFKGILNVGTS